MNKMSYTLPGFKGYSAIRNRQPTQASDIQNFIVRDTTLTTRKGCALVIGALDAQPECLYTFRKKSGTRYLMTADGANFRPSYANLSQWNVALKDNCNNARFHGCVFYDAFYAGNGTDALKWDGSTFTVLTGGTMPKFNYIASWKSRLWSNDATDNTVMFRSDAENGSTLSTDHYKLISENSGDPIQAFVPVLTHMLVVCSYNTYALYVGADADSFPKTLAGPVGTIAPKSLITLNETAYWLGNDGLYSYAGSGINALAFDLGDITKLIAMSAASGACGIGFDNYYWLAVPKYGSTTNDMVLLYDATARCIDIFIFPFSIYAFASDAGNLYCVASDKKLYQLNTGTTDAGTAITARWVSDGLDFGKPGFKKKEKVIAAEFGETSGGGTLNMYLKEDNGSYSSAYPITIPSSAPGLLVPTKVTTGKFYNLTIKLETTAAATINKLAFGGKVAGKVK